MLPVVHVVGGGGGGGGGGGKGGGWGRGGGRGGGGGGGGGGRLEMVRLWSLVRAQAVAGGHGVEADGEQPPPLVGESGILSRTVCCIQSEARTG